MKNKIGIVGGGQLGRMLALAAIPLGFEVTVLDPNPECPASACAKQIVGSFKDAKAIYALADQVDFLTFEIESANAEALHALCGKGFNINPTPSMLALIKDKYLQKEFYKKHQIPTTESYLVKSLAELKLVAGSVSYPFLLKARFDAYDGRGNVVIRSEEEIEKAWVHLGEKNLYVEKFVPFVKELAVIVARDQKGQVKSYQPVETIQKNNICHTVIAPAQIDSELSAKAVSLAERTVGHLEGAGVFGVEMFLTGTGEILLNEIAPRVHNSGHFTIEACITSQFEQHIRAVTGLPLGSTDLKVPATVMVNILGQKDESFSETGPAEALAIENIAVHMYGKSEWRPERKMGHITAIGETVKVASEKAMAAKNCLLQKNEGFKHE